MTDIFENATRQKLRFQSSIGDINTEQLWDLPLVAGRSRTPDLDSIGMAIQADIKTLSEGSLVKKDPDQRVAKLQAKLEVIKHIIATKQAEEEAEKTKAKKSAERRALLELLADKENEERKGLSKEEILKKLEEIDANG